MNIGVAANCELRNNGTFAYCHAALKGLAGLDVQHFQPRGEVPKKDFWIYIDDGRDDLQWLPPHPCAYYAIDTHLGYGYRLWKARQFDRVFVAQKDAVGQMKRDGVENVAWLPLGCHPAAHISRQEFIDRGAPAEDLKQDWDVAFVGFLNDSREVGFNNRVDYLDRLFREFPNSWLSVNVFFEEMALRFVRARLGFNISIKRDLNMRVFEVMSTGTALLTNRNVEGIDDFFEEGVDYFGYESPEEMIEAAHAALADPDNLARVAASAFQKVRSKHTYADRMKVIVEEMAHV